MRKSLTTIALARAPARPSRAPEGRDTASDRPRALDLREWIDGLVLVATIPAFYLALLDEGRAFALGLYGLAALSCIVRIGTSAKRAGPRGGRLLRAIRLADWMLAAGLVASTLLPVGDGVVQLSVRLGTELLAVLRMGESIRPWFWRSELPRFLALAVVVLALCGLGFWWLEPRVHGFGDGLWLAFTTAATVGYGDIVPSTPASKIFAVFVVLLGFAVLSLVTAAIAAMWVQSEEREIEGELLDDLSHQLDELHAELRSMRSELRGLTTGTASTCPSEP